MSVLVSLCVQHCNMTQMITTVACRWGQASSTWRFFVHGHAEDHLQYYAEDHLQ